MVLFSRAGALIEIFDSARYRSRRPAINMEQEASPTQARREDRLRRRDAVRMTSTNS